jgi:hypothetical protein
MNQIKLCQLCKKELSIDNFHNNKRTKDKLACYCKPCVKSNNKSYPVDREKRLLNKERYRFKHKLEINNNQNKKRHCRRFRTMLHRANSTSRLRYSGELITLSQLWRLAKRQRLICPISGIKLNNNNISLDHIIPFSQGGKNVIENIQLIDYNINIMKNSHSQQEFLSIIKTIYLKNFPPSSGDKV